jgi:hypothetical protein
MKTIETPSRKFIVKVCPNKAADAKPVNIVATVEEYFFKIVSVSLKKKNIQVLHQMNHSQQKTVAPTLFHPELLQLGTILTQEHCHGKFF